MSLIEQDETTSSYPKNMVMSYDPRNYVSSSFSAEGKREREREILSRLRALQSIQVQPGQERSRHPRGPLRRPTIQPRQL